MNSHHILLVDDEPNIIKALQRLLFDDDYEVTSAASGEDALEILNSHAIDLIIADYRMSGMNGIEFFRQARQIQPDAVRIILSGYAEIHALTDAINKGNIYRFIFKPWNDDELKNTIQLALEQKKLVLENRSLARELQRKNDELKDFNRRLEIQVAQRTRELLCQNQVLSVSQEVLELVPVGVVGFSDEGIVVLMNRFARGHLKQGVGQKIEQVVPETLARDCSRMLKHGGEPVDFEAEINDRTFQMQLWRLSGQDAASGAVLIFASKEKPARQHEDVNGKSVLLAEEPSLN